MDSTTVFLMRQAAITARKSMDSVARHQDSIVQAGKDASRATAEWILLRHDLVIVSASLLPSIALILSVWIYSRKGGG